MLSLIHSLMGFLAMAGLAALVSENRKSINLRQVMAGLGLQILLAFLLLKIPITTTIFSSLNLVVLSLQEASKAGTSFVFGYLGGGIPPFAETAPGGSFILAFQALPLILLVSALSALLFHWRIMPAIVLVFSRILQKSLNIGGALGVGAAANIFVGMVEAPLFIRPYLDRMTRSELFTVMTCGMATIAGTVMVLYATILQPVVPGVMGHILVASIISAPAAITVSRLMIPETGAVTDGSIVPSQKTTGAMDAITRGTSDGLGLLLNITTMLVVIIALVHLVNQLLALLPDLAGQPISLQQLLGWLLAPLAWLIGIPWSEAGAAASLLGTKTVMNEFLAYLQMSKLAPGTLSPRSEIIMLYALCGFANLGSLAIMIGGLGSMAPARRQEIVGLGLKSILAGTLATCMTGALAGLFFLF